MKTYYLLVPVKGLRFKTGMDISKIGIHVGRKGVAEAATALERDLNGGKTWREWLSSCASHPDFEKHKAEAWQVHFDTERSWRDYVGSQDWPAMKQIDDLNN